MRFHKFISVILHPIVIPTIGILLFFTLTRDRIPAQVQYLLLSIIFFSTYIVPIICLLLLKRFKLIESFQVKSITERKVPLFIMLIVFYILGSYLIRIPIFKALGILFHGTNIALIAVYVLFFFKIKTSLHIISMSSLFGFIILYCAKHELTMLPTAIPILLLTGLLGSSRLYLKAHTPREVYIAFFLGISSQYIAFMLL